MAARKQRDRRGAQGTARGLPPVTYFLHSGSTPKVLEPPKIALPPGDKVSLWGTF
jgi:hypothetical protein